MEGETDRSLPIVAEQRQIQLGAVRVLGRRRRPSGEKPPLPRALQVSGWLWLLSVVAVILAWLSLFVWPQTERLWYQADHRITFWLADLRNSVATGLMKGLHALGSDWTILILRWGTVLVLVAFRRWRHLVTFVVAITLLESFVNLVNLAVVRERPLAVEIIGAWTGSSHPSQPLASLTVTLVAMRYSLVPTRFRWKTRWLAIGLIVAALGVARVYLGVDHPTDVLFGFLLAGAIGVVTFRLMAPSTVFPVTYRVGTPAHVELGPERRKAITDAIHQQVGVDVVEVKPYRLEGSAGSTPLRITVRGEPEDHYVFAKLYASTHLRSDRWYKLARAILYGALEDEMRFNSVPQLVEHEDYMLRVMRDAGVQVAEPYGSVELIPEREYLIMTEFIDGAREIDDGEVSDPVIDSALQLVRTLWDARLAHRDVKPANLLVIGDKAWLIDVAFATARPTPWRQAVDLANMMLILGLQAEPGHVYRRAQLHFTPEDIAEAFAATKGVTMPTQLRARLRDYEKSQGTDLIRVFRELAPDAEPVSLQRWSVRRLALTGSVVVGTAGLAVLVLFNLQAARFL